MLEGKRIALIGGDKRYIQAIHHLANKNADVFIVGFSDINFEQSNIHQKTIHAIDFSQIDYIVLPILGLDEHGCVELNYPAGKATITKEMIQRTPEHCVIYTGTANDTLKNLAKNSNRKLMILFERDDMAIANSIPTAEATLQIAMENTDYTIHGANVLITGFGRVGITMARLFHQIGANVIVAARKQADFARIREMNMQPISLTKLIEVVEDTNICINTIPHLVITKDIIHVMNKNALIIDVASKPGGIDFDVAKTAGITTFHALGLPGKFAPKTAGNIIGHTIAELITENE